ncbi:hypothetical protein N7481_004187 [Penicillium waksmanii]|uniref:uncharacterized protein n=1 Tax=Penicillium waksmanii TaxID=69791 RepID=UPI002548A8F3|nr:uncharacterized protein N7481_004187 [Penicillium waksmanii]KAJ5988977.1 hypothetical protein N7481_004187 [Penicillium waksmanii]
MAVLTLVYRALPFSLLWKRRQSTSSAGSKGKEKEDEVQSPDSGYSSQSGPQIDYHDAEIPDASLHCDVSHALHIAVKQHLDPKAMRYDTQGDESVEEDASSSYFDSIPGCKPDRLAEKCEPSARPQLARVVSWASIVRSQCRWTSGQEKKLQDARRQLARCQKAWSSEQELWLAYIQALSEEKEAHGDFLLLRTRQQDDEQHQFRKAWKRRRSFETTLQLNSPTVNSNVGMSNKFRRLHRHGYLETPLVTTDSTVLACRG